MASVEPRPGCACPVCKWHRGERTVYAPMLAAAAENEAIRKAQRKPRARRT